MVVAAPAGVEKGGSCPTNDRLHKIIVKKLLIFPVEVDNGTVPSLHSILLLFHLTWGDGKRAFSEKKIVQK